MWLMLHDGCPPEAPTSAAGDSIILHVPSCVQRFSSRRRILSRLRSIARRRIRGLPEPPVGPVKLLVEENPHWPAAEEGPFAAEGESRLWIEDEAAGSIVPEEKLPGAGKPLPDAVEPEPAAEAAQGPAEDPNAAVIQQLMEDNRDLKAALCRLIRISEQNEAALRLLEEENEDLAALVHRLTIGQTKAVPAAAAHSQRPWWQRPGRRMAEAAGAAMHLIQMGVRVRHARPGPARRLLWTGGSSPSMPRPRLAGRTL